jgi:hypothetical protein
LNRTAKSGGVWLFQVFAFTSRLLPCYPNWVHYKYRFSGLAPVLFACNLKLAEISLLVEGLLFNEPC